MLFSWRRDWYQLARVEPVTDFDAILASYMFPWDAGGAQNQERSLKSLNLWK